MDAPAATAPSDANVRDAATVILVRDAKGPTPRILMGQRGAKAAFMPNKYVFPGGAVDPGDGQIALARRAAPDTIAKLAKHADPTRVDALLVAAIRELWEETGQVLG
ncbi:MAG TPA: NUDIX hydrolase, partial [Rhodobacterales bacterium]|nr:NUDIX hydrolase [Rhodobacterales bacterium]